MILSVGYHFICAILSMPFCPYHFVQYRFVRRLYHLSNTILSVYHFAHTILSVPFCPRTHQFVKTKQMTKKITSHEPYVCVFIVCMFSVSGGPPSTPGAPPPPGGSWQPSPSPPPSQPPPPPGSVRRGWFISGNE